MTHTPGPWRVMSNFASDRLLTIEADSILAKQTWRIGSVVANNSVGEANARLVAAAPDLLAALQELSHHCELDHDILPPDAGLLKTVRAAIAKATGAP